MGPGFGRLEDGHHDGVEGSTAIRQSDLPILLFVGARRSGPSRRMESLVAWVKVTQKARLRVVEVDGDRRLDVVRRFGIREFPSLVLIVRRRVVGRLEGKATGNEIDRLLRTHLPA
ncbi:MAG TPA: thioredoxin family protein [Gaiella sp.]|nr:thioredoxin family protein [Gaiella sp.]